MQEIFCIYIMESYMNVTSEFLTVSLPEKLFVLCVLVAQSIVPCYSKTFAELRNHQTVNVALRKEI